jgi:hypothetical protein
MYGDSIPLPAGLWTVLDTAHAYVLWQDKRIADAIRKELGKQLPDLDELNEQIPQDQWEIGPSGTKTPPWVRQAYAYLLHEVSAELVTFITSSIGGFICIRELRDRVRWRRRLRGPDLLPVVELASAPMRTRYGVKLRPAFTVTAWRNLSSHQTPALAAPADDRPLSNDKPSLAEDLDDGIAF